MPVSPAGRAVAKGGIVSVLLAFPFVLFLGYCVLRVLLGAVSARYGEHDGLRYAAGFLIAAFAVVVLLIIANARA